MRLYKQKSLRTQDYPRISYRKFMNRLFLALLSGTAWIPYHQVNAEEIFLKCTGQFEVNRGELIKPDWVTSYLSINTDGLISTIDEGGIKKEGRTLIRRNSYMITHRDNKNKIKAKYLINGNYRNYTVNYPQSGKILIGTCQKGRG